MYILIGILLVCSFKTTGIPPRPEVGRLDQMPTLGLGGGTSRPGCLGG